MVQLLKEKYTKHKEVINYLIFGVLTTIVNFIVYIALISFENIHKTFANATAWFISVVFAYITNKKFVFESKSNTIIDITKEFASFLGSRILSGAFDIISFDILVDKLAVNDIIAKVVISILVVILNYIFSKLLVFRKKREEEK